MRFELRDHDGRPIALAEAADAADVDLYGHRHVPGFSRAVPVPAPTDHGPALEVAFRRMGSSESAARIAARGRDTGPGPSLPFHRVPRQEARQGRSQAAASTPTIVSETTTRRAR